MTAEPDPLDLKKLRSVHRQVPRAATLRTITALILREMSATYGRSPGGYVWAILEPALGIIVMVVLFSTGFRSPPLGTNFAIFYASGLLPFMMFLTIVTKMQQSINFSRQLLSYPRVTFIDALLARFLLNVLTQGVVAYLIFSFILYVWDTRTILDFGRLLNAYAMAIALGFGVGVMNCLLITRYPLWGAVWGMTTRPLVLVSGVIFLHDRIPQPYRDYLGWNPLVHVVGEARRAFYYSYDGAYVNETYVYVCAVISTMVGLLFLRSYYRDFMEL